MKSNFKLILDDIEANPNAERVTAGLFTSTSGKTDTGRPTKDWSQVGDDFDMGLLPKSVSRQMEGQQEHTQTGYDGVVPSSVSPSIGDQIRIMDGRIFQVQTVDPFPDAPKRVGLELEEGY